MFKRLIATGFSVTLLSLGFLSSAANAAPPRNFQEAKKIARNYIYHDQNTSPNGTIYCGCQWQWTTSTGGAPVLNSCGYEVRKLQDRAAQTEWEHVVPAYVFGHQRQCWQKGGRKNCEKNDPVFNMMEADLFNLTVSVGEVNADRSNFDYGVVTTQQPMYGACGSKTDFQQKIFEPRDEAKGEVARITFYMYDRYNLKMSEREQKLLMAWDKEHPVSEWEKTRDNRINAFMGHHNEFVTGRKKWTLGYKPEGAGLKEAAKKFGPDAVNPGGEAAVSSDPEAQNLDNPQAVEPGPVIADEDNTVTPANRTQGPFDEAVPRRAADSNQAKIIANKNSKKYHLPGCPSYTATDEKNRVYFGSEQEALDQGFVKAGNCNK